MTPDAPIVQLVPALSPYLIGISLSSLRQWWPPIIVTLTT